MKGAPVATIAGARDETVIRLAPKTIAYLQIPLTPTRQAALAAFTARTGIAAQQLAADLLDDVIFDKGE